MQLCRVPNNDLSMSECCTTCYCRCTVCTVDVLLATRLSSSSYFRTHNKAFTATSCPGARALKLGSFLFVFVLLLDVTRSCVM